MAVSYICPNPDCGVTLKTPNRVQPGKSVKCPHCKKPFVPESEEEAPPPPGTLKFADEPVPKKPKPSGSKKSGNPAQSDAKPEPPPAKTGGDDDDEDAESIKKGYGVIRETAEEIEEADKNKPKFTEVQDKFKKSARGPALALLVMPSNLLTFEGIATVVMGIVIFVVGVWPLIFNDAPPGEEETEEALQQMALGMFTFFWGAMVCYGASQMHEIESYTWAMVGAIMGILPLLIGIFGIIMLQNPKVKAGFEEGEGGPDEDEEEDSKKKEGEDDEEDEDEDDD
jgi:hypothetical protein